MADSNINDLIWKCKDCDVSGPPTNYDYMRLIKHQKGHQIRLVNKASGEVVAATPKQAREKGIEFADAKRTPGGWMELTEEGLMLPITFPPVLLTMFDVAKAAELVEEETDLDSWLFECVQKRFELDYHRKLMLVPTEEEKK